MSEYRWTPQDLHYLQASGASGKALRAYVTATARSDKRTGFFTAGYASLAADMNRKRSTTMAAFAELIAAGVISRMPRPHKGRQGWNTWKLNPRSYWTVAAAFAATIRERYQALMEQRRRQRAAQQLKIDALRGPISRTPIPQQSFLSFCTEAEIAQEVAREATYCGKAQDYNWQVAEIARRLALQQS